MLHTRDSLQKKGHTQTESEEMEKYIHVYENEKKAGVAIVISDKINFKTKTNKRDKEGLYIMIKGSIQEQDITIVNIYAPNIGAPQYIRQVLTAIKGEIDSDTIIVGDLKTPLSPMDRSSKMKINNIGHSIQKQQNTLSSQVLMEHSPG